MTMRYTIVDMTARHLRQVALLERLCFSLPWSEDSLLGELQNPLTVMLCALDGDGAVVGWAGFGHVCGEASVTNVAVHPDVRRRGLGEALTRALVARAAGLALTGVTLEVRAANAGAVALYRKLGFLPLGLRPGFYDHPREDALMMRLSLVE